MTKTILIMNGASPKGRMLCRQLLSENNYSLNAIKHKIICIDSPENQYKVQDLLSFDEFVFYAFAPNSPIGISEKIDDVIFVK